jgi:hypothetical protein
MLCAKLVWCCLVIVLGFLLTEPSCSMTTTMNHPHPDGCAIYHITRMPLGVAEQIAVDILCTTHLAGSRADAKVLI